MALYENEIGDAPYWDPSARTSMPQIDNTPLKGGAMNECTHKKEGKKCPYENERKIGEFRRDTYAHSHLYKSTYNNYLIDAKNNFIPLYCSPGGNLISF